MTDETANSREQGIEFGDLHDDLEGHDYPASTEEIVAEYGDRDLELPSGEQTVEDVLGPLAAEGGQTYGSAGEVQQSVLNMVGDDAVGSTGYSDRGGSPAASESDDETDSF